MTPDTGLVLREVDVSPETTSCARRSQYAEVRQLPCSGFADATGRCNLVKESAAELTHVLLINLRVLRLLVDDRTKLLGLIAVKCEVDRHRNLTIDEIVLDTAPPLKRFVADAIQRFW